MQKLKNDILLSAVLCLGALVAIINSVRHKATRTQRVTKEMQLYNENISLYDLEPWWQEKLSKYFIL